MDVNQFIFKRYAKYELFSKIEANDPNLIKLEVAYNFSDAGYILNNNAKYEEAFEVYEVSLAILRKFYNDDANKDVTETLKSIGQVLTSLERFDQANVYFIQLLDAIRKINGNTENENVAEVIQFIGVNCFRSGKLDEAIKYLTESKSIFLSLYNTNQDPKIYDSLMYIEQHIVLADIMKKQKEQKANQEF